MALGVGFIGCGRISDLMALACARTSDAKLVAVCDVDAERAEAKRGEFGAERSYGNADDLLADPDVDLAVVMTPHDTHADVAIACAQAGKHVCVQKPIARTLDETDRIIDAASDAGVLLHCFENYRGYPPFRRAMELIERGEIGEVQAVRFVSNSSATGGWAVPGDALAWRLDPERCGGEGPFVIDDGYHKFSIVRLFLGPVRRVWASVRRTEVVPGISVDAPFVAVLEGEGNRQGVIEGRWTPTMMIPTDYYSIEERLEVTGSDGIIWVNQCTSHPFLGPPLLLFRDGRIESFDLPWSWETSFVELFGDLVRGVHAGSVPSLTGSEARDVLAVILAALRSSREGRPIDLA